MQCYQLAQRRDLPSLSPTSQPRAKRGFSLRRGSELRGEWRTPSSTSMRDSAKRKPRCSGGRRAAPPRRLLRVPSPPKKRPGRNRDGPPPPPPPPPPPAPTLGLPPPHNPATRNEPVSPPRAGA